MEKWKKRMFDYYSNRKSNMNLVGIDEADGIDESCMMTLKKIIEKAKTSKEIQCTKVYEWKS